VGELAGVLALVIRARDGGLEILQPAEGLFDALGVVLPVRAQGQGVGGQGGQY
jgi:hypothetical protein